MNITKISIELNPEKEFIEFIKLVFPVKSETKDNYILATNRRLKKNGFWHIRSDDIGRSYRYYAFSYEDSESETKERLTTRLQERITEERRLVNNATKIFVETDPIVVREIKFRDL